MCNTVWLGLNVYDLNIKQNKLTNKQKLNEKQLNEKTDEHEKPENTLYSYIVLLN